MLHKFNVKIDEDSLSRHLQNSDLNNSESLIYNNKKDDIVKKIKSIAVVDDEKKEVTIKHEDILNDWFPESGCHIFLSHSHQDKSIAIKIANNLYQNYKIKTFIDSDFWQFVDDAINEINSEYSKCPAPQDHLLRYDSCLMVGTNFYLTLSNALMDAIDKSDCCLFLNTEKSIKKIGTEIEATYSPWIYTELNILEKIRINPHKDRSIDFPAGMENMGIELEKALASNSKITTESYKINVEYVVDPSFKLSTIDSDTFGLILSSPGDIVPNYESKKNVIISTTMNTDFQIKTEKIMAINHLDSLYDFIFSKLPKVIN
ncbi:MULTISPECIES: toll/interleukin-1 receptor domain-containing protein [Pectobacterium]|uniref:toll/interleukin-1 receptor domain-containing protein n=1 Tax=Pectobacterium TaxID=122277 RepID=UPI001F114168|nr:toll/interleukin-1 receptor domain-containing protein [Pectobacterium aquaticum]MCH5049003.1 toll/interleukin-1 receptor domain-containing protein [Pectobacterium aquaticum]